MSNQTITAHILYRPSNDVAEVDTLEVEVMKDEERGLWHPVSNNRIVSAGTHWRGGARYFDPMVPTDGVYLKLQATKDPNGEAIFKRLDFNPEDFHEPEIGIGFGNESLPQKLYDFVQRDSNLAKMYSAMGMYQQQALLGAIAQQTMQNPLSFRAGVLFCNGNYRER